MFCRVEPSAGLTLGPIGFGFGHFIVEEAPQETVEQLNEFMDRLGVSKESVFDVAEEKMGGGQGRVQKTGAVNHLSEPHLWP